MTYLSFTGCCVLNGHDAKISSNHWDGTNYSWDEAIHGPWAMVPSSIRDPGLMDDDARHGLMGAWVTRLVGRVAPSHVRRDWRDSGEV